jgi:hypothetical protein
LESKTRRRKIYFWCTGVLLIGLGYLLAFSGLFRITNISVSGATPEHERLVRESVSVILQRRRWLVLPGNNGLWISPERLAQNLLDILNGQASFEELKVTKPMVKKITVAVKERTAALLWQAAAKQYFLLDGRGVVLSPVTISDEQPAPDLPLVKNVAKAATTIGAEILTAAQAETITTGVQLFKQRFPELAVNYATPINRESVRTVCADDSTPTNSNRNINTNSNANRNTNTNSSSQNANIRPSNANLNSNAASDTNSGSNSNAAAPCEAEEVSTSRYAREILVNVAKDTDIYFSADEPVESQINAVGLLLNEKISDIDKVSYIDVRYLPRAYYK